MDKKFLKVVVLFVVFYVIMYVIGLLTPLEDWNSPTFFLIPFPAFFFMYFVIDWFNDFFETKFADSVFFPLLFVVGGFAAYYIVLWWYFGNIAQLNGIESVPYDYWEFLRHDSFVVFIFAGLSAWLTKLIVRKTDES